MNLHKAELETLLQSPELTEGEKNLLRWQYRLHGEGSFQEGLWKVIARADSTNIGKLARAFPEELTAYVHFAHTGEFKRKCYRILGREG